MLEEYDNQDEYEHRYYIDSVSIASERIGIGPFVKNKNATFLFGKGSSSSPFPFIERNAIVRNRKKIFKIILFLFLFLFHNKSTNK
jgi:hypothetical protein